MAPRTSSRRSRKKPPIKRLTHKARAARRKSIAKFVASGGTHAEAARKFGLTIVTVQIACKEFGVTAP